MIFAFIVFLLSLIFYTLFHFKLSRGLVFCLKILTSQTLFLFGIFAYFKSSNMNYAQFILIGLTFGVLGDIFLGLQKIDRKHKQFHLLIGISSFLLGHIFYSIAFQKYSELTEYIYLPIPIILTLGSIIIILFSKTQLGKAKYLSFAYVLVSAFFLTFAFGTFKNGFSLFSLAVAIGALSFSFSDFILCFLYFRSVKKYRLLKYINIILYYLGQILIASSIWLI